MSKQDITEKYKRLGGFLLFIVVMGIITTVFSFSLHVTSTAEIIQDINEAATLYTALRLIGTLLTFVALMIYVLQYISIIKRTHLFLRYYQTGFGIMMIANLLSYAAQMYLGELDTSSIVFMVIWFPIAMALYTLYFCKSIRVQTYMGGTEYMSKALFAFK